MEHHTSHKTNGHIKGNILIADDNIENLRLLTKMLENKQYTVRATRNSTLVLAGAKAELPDLILLDINMPQLNGFEVCLQLKEDPATCDIPIIFISAVHDTSNKVKAFQFGAVDYITKPFQIEEVLARVQTHLTLQSTKHQLKKANLKLEQWNNNLEQLVSLRSTELEKAYLTTIKGWANALELRDFETKGHSQRVTKLASSLAYNLGLEKQALTHIQRGAILHDIGKMGIPDNILLKPGPLSKSEWAIMKKHPEYGFEFLKNIEFLHPALDIVLHHHEKWDGSGYPHGIAGKEIPLSARIFSLIDVWDALTHQRPYKAAWSFAKTTEHIQSMSGIHFDPELISPFFEMLNSFLKKSPPITLTNS